MKRAQYDAIVQALLEAKPDEPEDGDDWDAYTIERVLWEAIVRKVAVAIERTGGFTPNGNRRFPFHAAQLALGIPVVGYLEEQG